MPVFLDASTAVLSKKYSLFLPQKFGSSQEPELYLMFPPHCLFILGQVIVILRFRGA